ncbi:leucine-rich repeat domain-containing protein [Cloacibacterium sp.]|uniref:leucine-rich repeat domain-containing protein n=1 Tax=Cloacibacterium sp. TaxID=1913682 RepID=UPI0039E294A1
MKTKKNMKQIFTFFSLLATVFLLHAQDYTANNIKYYITDATNHYVEIRNSSSASGAITLPSTVTINGISYAVTSIGAGTFESCIGLTSITIPNSVTSIGGNAFSSCSGLTSIIIPNSVTSIGNYAFSYCTGLTSITIPNSVTSIGEGTFFYCTGLNSVTIPNSVTSIGRYAFFTCTGLTSVTIPNSVISIDEGAFQSCTGLTSVTIPNSVTTIGDIAFYECSGLTSITIPNSVTSINTGAFASCTGLTSIIIPNSVTFIGEYAFASCTGLTSIDCYITTPLTIDSLVFDGVNQSTCALNVPSGSVSAYQSANVWKDFLIKSLGTLNTSNVQSANNLKIYPNPATDFVMVQNAKNIKISKINITDTHGRIVSTLNHLENGKIDVTKLPKGMYIISIFSEKDTENFKLMKK